MHYHTSYELYYLQFGNREYFIEDKLFSVSAGDFVLIPPGQIHRTGGEYGERILVDFSAKFLAQYYSPSTCEQLLTCFEHRKYTPTPTQQKPLIDLLTKMLDTTDETESALLLGHLLFSLKSCDKQELQEDYVSSIVAFINQNYGVINNITDISDHFFISKYHLCRVFKNSMKITVVDYLNHIRVKNACQMLQFSQKSIADISEACGYHSTAYFSSVFRQIVGCAPSEYRHESQKE